RSERHPGGLGAGRPSALSFRIHDGAISSRAPVPAGSHSVRRCSAGPLPVCSCNARISLRLPVLCRIFSRLSVPRLISPFPLVPRGLPSRLLALCATSSRLPVLFVPDQEPLEVPEAEVEVARFLLGRGGVPSFDDDAIGRDNGAGPVFAVLAVHEDRLFRGV